MIKADTFPTQLRWSTGPATIEHRWPMVSIIVVNFNGLAYLPPCLSSLLLQDYPSYEILLIDNGSTDGSLDLVRRDYPAVKLIQSSENMGYSGAINKAAEYASGELITILNMDVIVEPGWLAPLVEFLQQHPQVGAVTPQILLLEKPETINALGQNVHVTGLGFNRRLHYPLSSADRMPVQVSGLQGAAFVLSRRLFKAIGGMNEANFMYHEDVDISWLINLAGYDIYTVHAVGNLS